MNVFWQLKNMLASRHQTSEPRIGWSNLHEHSLTSGNRKESWFASSGWIMQVTTRNFRRNPKCPLEAWNQNQIHCKGCTTTDSISWAWICAFVHQGLHHKNNAMQYWSCKECFWIANILDGLTVVMINGVTKARCTHFWQEDPQAWSEPLQIWWGW